MCGVQCHDCANAVMVLLRHAVAHRLSISFHTLAEEKKSQKAREIGQRWLNIITENKGPLSNPN